MTPLILNIFSSICSQLYNFTLIYICPQSRIEATAAVLWSVYLVKCGKSERVRQRECCNFLIGHFKEIQRPSAPLGPHREQNKVKLDIL